MSDRSLTLTGYFDVIGREASHVHRCFFDVVTDVTPKVTLHAAGRSITNPSADDYARLTPRPVTGVLRNATRVFINTKLDFVSRVTSGGLVSSCTVASTTTDVGGHYSVWIEPGVYDVVVHARSGELVLNNIKVGNGLRAPFTTSVDGLIHAKHDDIVTFNGVDLVQARGVIVDASNNPVANAKLVVVNTAGSLEAYAVTDANGVYTFALSRGLHDVWLRGPSASVKIARSVIVDGERGFAEQLGCNSIIFGRQAIVLA